MVGSLRVKSIDCVYDTRKNSNSNSPLEFVLLLSREPFNRFECYKSTSLSLVKGWFLLLKLFLETLLDFVRGRYLMKTLFLWRSIQGIAGLIHFVLSSLWAGVAWPTGDLTRRKSYSSFFIFFCVFTSSLNFVNYCVFFLHLIMFCFNCVPVPCSYF